MTPITKTQWVKVAKTAAYVALSALISYAITLTTDQPGLFGTYAGLVNVLLVAAKQLFTSEK